MTKDEVAEFLQEITILHMDLEVDIDKLMGGDYPERPMDFFLLGVKTFYKRYLTLLKPGEPKHLQQRALEYAKRDAIQDLFIHWDGVIDAAKVAALSEAENSGWYRSDWFGYEHVEDLINSIVTDRDSVSRSEINDWKIIVEKVLPQAKRQNIPVSMLMKATLHRKKFRTAVPAFNYILTELENGRLTPEYTKKAFISLLNDVVDEKKSVEDIFQKQQNIRNAVVAAPEILEGSAYSLPVRSGSDYWIVIPCSDRERQAIEQLLRQKVAFEIHAVDDLLLAAVELFRLNEAERLFKEAITRAERRDNGGQAAPTG